MANVQFGGLISGLDVNALISGLVKAEGRSIEVLKGQKAGFQAKDAVITSVIGSLASLRSAALNLSVSTDFSRRQAASSNEAVLSASAGTTAQLGSSLITVDKLANAQSVQSTSFAGTTAALGTGTLTLTIGGVATNIVVDSANNTLTGLKDAINNSAAKVNASIVNVGSGTADYRLVVESEATGTVNAVTISGTLTGGADPFAGGGQVVQAASDARLSVNGLAVTRSSNTITDVLPGVTLTLLNEGDGDGVIETSDASAKVTVTNDSGAVQAALEKLVSSFNAVNKIINDQFTVKPNSDRQGVAAGDASLRGVAARLRQELSAAGGTSSRYRSLSDVGIAFQKDGSLTLDSAKLANALSDDATAVSHLFIGLQNGIGKRIPDTVDDFVSAIDGTLTFRQSGIGQSIKRIDDKIAQEEARLVAMEQRLTKQFTALEKIVSQLKSQGEYLTQQVGALSLRR